MCHADHGVHTLKPVAVGKIANIIPDTAIERSKERGHTIPITFLPEGEEDLKTFLVKVSESTVITAGGPEGPLVVRINGITEFGTPFDAEYHRFTKDGPIRIYPKSARMTAAPA